MPFDRISLPCSGLVSNMPDESSPNLTIPFETPSNSTLPLKESFNRGSFPPGSLIVAVDVKMIKGKKCHRNECVTSI